MSYKLREALTSSFLSKIGALLAKPALLALHQKLDPRRYNGAMLLGLNGICIKSHGGTDALGFANALQVAVDLAGKGINESIKTDYAQLCADAEGNRKAVVG
jgi:glycerol-3-phosphate acyltransferase PlsX